MTCLCSLSQKASSINYFCLIQKIMCRSKILRLQLKHTLYDVITHRYHFLAFNRNIDIYSSCSISLVIVWSFSVHCDTFGCIDSHSEKAFEWMGKECNKCDYLAKSLHALLNVDPVLINDEPEIMYGTAFLRNLTQIWNMRISFV